MSEKKTRKTAAPKRGRSTPPRQARETSAGKPAREPMSRVELERLREKLRRKFH